MNYLIAMLVVLKNRLGLFFNEIKKLLFGLFNIVENLIVVIISVICLLYFVFIIFDVWLYVFDGLEWFFGESVIFDCHKNLNKNSFYCLKPERYYVSFLIHNIAVIYYSAGAINKHKFWIFVWCCFALFLQNYFISLQNYNVKYIVRAEAIGNLTILCMSFIEALKSCLFFVKNFVNDVEKIYNSANTNYDKKRM